LNLETKKKMQENEQYYNGDFQHGYLTGVENIDKSTYEGYLSSHVNYDWLQERIVEKRQEATKIDTEIAEAKEKKKAVYDNLQNFSIGFNSKAKEVGRIEEEINTNSLKISSLEKKKNHNDSPYSLLAGVLYLLAGIAFILGDLIISHEIVAYALNIRNNIEAWSFAVGLAMLSILLKPAYERLVEQPYLHEYSPKTKRIYGYFQSFLLIFTIGTMFILGWFRYEAYKTDKLKEGINKQIKAMQLSTQSLDPTIAQPTDNQAIIQKMDEQMKAYDALNMQLVNSPWALFSFVLSGILFAIAGAICLGIAFPILQAYWYRWLQANPAIKRLKKENLKLKESLKIAENELAEREVQRNVLEHDLTLLPNLDELKAEKVAILKEIAELLKDSKISDQDRRINTFNDGFAKGQATELTDEEAEDLRKAMFRQVQHGEESKTDPTPKVYRSNGLRPHQALRKVITDQFNQN
jgi:hypothetical protein